MEYVLQEDTTDDKGITDEVEGILTSVTNNSNLPCGHWNKIYDYEGSEILEAICRDCGKRVAPPPKSNNLGEKLQK